MTIGMSADHAIVQGCADCHNNHPKTTKKDWKLGDFMGAIVVRMKINLPLRVPVVLMAWMA